MNQLQLQFSNRGNRADYVLGTLEGWGAFDVVRWRAVEELSRPFEYELTLLRDAAAGPVDLDGLLDTGATLRIATESGWRPVHGIIAEAEEIERTSQLLFYRLLLVPHVWRARYRTSCRTYRRKSIVEIVSMALENRAPGSATGAGGLVALGGAAQPPKDDFDVSTFAEPGGAYRFAIGDDSRFTDEEYRTHVVQYRESDFDFVSRLLEEEGLTYFFEQADDHLVMTITDQPGNAPLFARDPVFHLRAGGQGLRGQRGEVLRTLRDARRMRSRAVRIRDYFEQVPLTLIEAESVLDKSATGAAEHFDFPCPEGQVASPCVTPARVRLERFQAERALATGSGTVRTMEPGLRFTLRDDDGLRSDADFVVVRVDTMAVQLQPAGIDLDDVDASLVPTPTPPLGLRNRFAVLPAGVPFRPAARTLKPVIQGIHPAIVTAEEFAPGSRPEINANKSGDVRIRFPWDRRPEEAGIPSSRFVTVSQYWAGVGYGALHTPRVGDAVLVAFVDGDPDRPVVVGRVYSDQHPAPYDPEERPTVSTWKSHSSPDAEGSNELRFEDLAKKEEIFLHAQRDLNEVVRASHSTSVGGDQSNSVGNNQTNMVRGNRTHAVSGTEDVIIISDRTGIFAANEKRSVGVNRSTEVGATDRLETTTRVTVVKGDDMSVVSGQDVVQVSGTRTVQVGVDHLMEAGSNHSVKSSNTYFYPSGDFQVNSTTAGFNQGASFYVKAGGCTLSMSAGILVIDNGAGASIALVGGLVTITAAGAIVNTSAGPYSIAAGGPMGLVAGGDISASAPTIKLNG